jgi:hypothetical protein
MQEGKHLWYPPHAVSEEADFIRQRVEQLRPERPPADLKRPDGCVSSATLPGPEPAPGQSQSYFEWWRAAFADDGYAP